MKIVKITMGIRLLFGRGGISAGPGRTSVKREQEEGLAGWWARARMRWAALGESQTFEKEQGMPVNKETGSSLPNIFYLLEDWSVINSDSYTNKESNIISFSILSECPIPEPVIANMKCMVFLFDL